MENNTKSSVKLLQGPKVKFWKKKKKKRFFQDTELCVFKQRKQKTLMLVSSLANKSTSWVFDPPGHTYGLFPPIHMRWLFHVHKAMKRLSHIGVEAFSLWSSVKYIHWLIDRLSDWLTDRLSVVCICVVLRYSKKKTEWFVNVCVL